MKPINKGILFITFLTALFTFVSACSQSSHMPVMKDFSVKLPESWNVDDPRPDDPREVLYVHTGVYKVPSLTANKISPEEVVSTDASAKHVCESMAKYFRSKSCDVMYSKEIQLNDGSKAFETMIKWKHPFADFFTVQIMTAKGNRAFTVAVHGMQPPDDGLKGLLHTFSINQ